MPETPLWIWDEKSKRYRDTASGRYVGVETMNTLRVEYVTKQKDIYASYAAKYRTGTIDLPALEAKMKQMLKDTYIDMYAMGAGGRNNMTQSDWGKIGAMLKEQYGMNGYMRGFMEAIARGELSEAQIAARMNMYINSANEALWKGYAKDLPLKLPAYPGDGSTVCLTACQCSWDIRKVENGYDCYWRLGRAEHCPDCLGRSLNWAPYQIRVGGG